MPSPDESTGTNAASGATLVTTPLHATEPADTKTSANPATVTKPTKLTPAQEMHAQFLLKISSYNVRIAIV